MQRNVRLDETATRDAVASLRAALPPTWSATTRAADPNTAPVSPDALLEITPGEAPGVTFAIQVNTRSPSVAAILGQLKAFKAVSSRPLIFVTEYINPTLRRACRESGLNYLDTTGWAYIANESPPMLIQLEGAVRPPKRRESNPTARLNGPAAGRAIRCLLERDPPVGVRELAELSSSSPAAVSKLIPALTAAGAVDRDERGTIVRIRRRALLERWTADYSFLKSNGAPHYFVAPRGLDALQKRIADRVDTCATGSIAARAYLPQAVTSVIPIGLAALYAEEPDVLARELKLVGVSREMSNVILVTPKDDQLLATRNRSDIGVPIAPLGQVLADLVTLPGRIAQEAEQLIALLAQTDPSWSE